MAKDKELAASEKEKEKKSTAKKDSDKKTSEKKTSEKSEKKDSKKKDQSKKQGGIAKWFKDLKNELKKVVWPDKKTVVNNSIVVFAAMLGFAVYTFLLDQGFLWLFQFAISGKS